MGRNKQIILIPFWIQETLIRNGLPLSACLEFDKIKPIVSFNDLTLFAALQTYFDYVIGGRTYGTDLSAAWSDNIAEDDPKLKMYKDMINNLSGDETIRKEVWCRLFDEGSKVEHYEVPFNTYDLTAEVCGVVIYPGFFLSDCDFNQQKNVVESVLKVLYVYNEYYRVAQTPLFKRYLELLSQK